MNILPSILPLTALVSAVLLFTVIDSGVADSLTERELGKDAYAMFFN